MPEHTTLCRRAANLEIQDLSSKLESNEIINVVIVSTGLKIYAPGEWHQCKHRLKERRSWCKLHLGIAKENNMNVCAELTTHDVGDPTAVLELLNAVNQDIGIVTGDGAYDSAEIYRFAKARGAKAIIRPASHAVLSKDYRTKFTERDQQVYAGRAKMAKAIWLYISKFSGDSNVPI